MTFHVLGITFAHLDGVTVAVIPDWALLLDTPIEIGIGWLGYRAAKWWRGTRG